MGGPPYDLEEPAFGVPLAITVEITKRPQTSLLHNIGGVGIVARQPARKRETGVEMGQHHRLEPALPTPLRDPRHARSSTPYRPDRSNGQFIPRRRRFCPGDYGRAVAIGIGR